MTFLRSTCRCNTIFPEDASSHGFDNVAESLRISMLHMEQYLEAADAAVTAALDLRARPSGSKTRFRYHDEESVLNDAKKTGKKSFRILPDAVVVFDDNFHGLHRFRGHERGRYKIKISAYAYQAAGRPAGQFRPDFRPAASVTSTCP